MYFSGAKAGFVFYALCDRLADLLHCKPASRISRTKAENQKESRNRCSHRMCDRSGERSGVWAGDSALAADFGFCPRDSGDVGGGQAGF